MFWDINKCLNMYSPVLCPLKISTKILQEVSLWNYWPLHMFYFRYNSYIICANDTLLNVICLQVKRWINLSNKDLHYNDPHPHDQKYGTQKLNPVFQVNIFLLTKWYFVYIYTIYNNCGICIFCIGGKIGHSDNSRNQPPISAGTLSDFLQIVRKLMKVLRF